MTKRSNEVVVLVAMIGIFLGVSLWMLSRTENTEEQFPPMSTFSARPSGAMALFELLERENLAPQRFTETEYEYPDNSCMVVMPRFSDPVMMLFTALDPKRLILWMEDGNSLVLVAGPLSPLCDGLLNELGMDIVPEVYYRQEVQASYAGDGQQGNMGALLRQFRSGRVYEMPEDAPPLWDGLETFEVADPDTYTAGYSPSPWTTGGTGDAPERDPEEPAFAEALLSAGDPAQPVLLHFQVGEGELLWLSRPEMAANSWINRADNHRVLLSLIDYAGRGKQIYFDEHIHGFSTRHIGVGTMLFHTGGGMMLLALACIGVLLFLGDAIRPARFHPLVVKRRRQAKEAIHAQADLYRRAELRVVVADYLVDGLRRTVAASTRSASMFDNHSLASWLERRLPALARSENTLMDFLEKRTPPQSAKDLFALAKACHLAQTRIAG